MFRIRKTNVPATDDQGLLCGKGVWELPDGSRYEGEHYMGYRQGKGVLTLPDGTCQAGWFEKDVYIGPEKKQDTPDT